MNEKMLKEKQDARSLGSSSAFCLLASALFFVLYTGGPKPADDWQEAIEQVTDPDARHYLTYGNAPFVHNYRGSPSSKINAAACAVLGVPSITFGIPLLKNGAAGRVAGASLILSAAADSVGLGGALADNEKAGFGLIAGAFFFLVSLVALTVLSFQRTPGDDSSTGGA